MLGLPFTPEESLNGISQGRCDTSSFKVECHFVFTLIPASLFHRVNDDRGDLSVRALLFEETLRVE